MEPWVVEQLWQTLKTQKCGFVGAFPTGLSYRENLRPQQQIIEFWEGSIHPEIVNQ